MDGRRWLAMGAATKKEQDLGFVHVWCKKGAEQSSTEWPRRRSTREFRRSPANRMVPILRCLLLLHTNGVDASLNFAETGWALQNGITLASKREFFLVSKALVVCN